MTTDEDELFKCIDENMPDNFEKAVNDILMQGGWRLVAIEISVIDNMYYAFLIRSKQ